MGMQQQGGSVRARPCAVLRASEQVLKCHLERPVYAIPEATGRQPILTGWGEGHCDGFWIKYPKSDSCLSLGQVSLSKP